MSRKGVAGLVLAVVGVIALIALAAVFVPRSQPSLQKADDRSRPPLGDRTIVAAAPDAHTADASGRDGHVEIAGAVDAASPAPNQAAPNRVNDAANSGADSTLGVDRLAKDPIAKGPKGFSAQVTQTITNMLSDNDAIRRPARTQLGQLVSADDSLAPLLVRDMISDAYPPESRYRYQVGVAVALGSANAPNGWAADLASRDILSKLKQTNKDPTLAANLASALNNMRGYVFYDAGGDGWLTKNGQLRPVGQKKPPLPPFASLAPKTVLQADSAVNMRAGPSGGAEVLDNLSQGDCVRVVSAEKGDGAGGWLQAVRTKC